MLTVDAYERLKAAGYTDEEIKQFGEGTDPSGGQQPAIDLTDKPWIAAMADRRKWKDSLMDAGWSEEQFERNIHDQYNRDPRQSPWDFLKSEYKPPQKADFKSTIEATARVREFKKNVRRTLRVEGRRLYKPIQEQTVEEFHESGLGETIRRLNRRR
jgi:hypothetical protein